MEKFEDTQIRWSTVILHPECWVSLPNILRSANFWPIYCLQFLKNTYPVVILRGSWWAWCLTCRSFSSSFPKLHDVIMTDSYGCILLTNPRWFAMDQSWDVFLTLNMYIYIYVCVCVYICIQSEPYAEVKFHFKSHEVHQKIVPNLVGVDMSCWGFRA